MENNDFDQFDAPVPGPNEAVTPERLVINAETTGFWKRSGAWAMFLSILGFPIGLFYLLACIGTLWTVTHDPTDIENMRRDLALIAFGRYTMVLVFGVIALTILSTSVFHLLFATNIRSAVTQKNQSAFSQSWRYFLSHLRISGVAMGLYALLLIGILIFYIYMIIQLSSRFSME